MEHLLRIYSDYLQDDWADRLPLAEFAYNSAPHSSIKQPPFHVVYGFNPRDALAASAPASDTVPDASLRVANLEAARRLATLSLHAARDRMEALSVVRTSTAPTIQVGDRVLLSSQHVATTRPIKKLDDKFIGPYTVTEQTGSHNFRLAIPGKNIHNVFHVDRLRPYVDPSTFPGRTPLARPPPVIASSNEYEVSRILDCRRKKGKAVKYFVEWKGYGSEDRQWVDAADFDEDDEVVLDFARRGMGVGSSVTVGNATLK